MEYFVLKDWSVNGRSLASTPPGSSTRELCRQRREKRRAISVAAIGTVVITLAAYFGYLSFGHEPQPEHAIILLLYLLFMLVVNRVVITGMDWLWVRERQAVNGARAEEKLGALLKDLSDDCVVLHDLNTGRGNIDHLVLRKDGAIFLIETRSHHGRITTENGELRRDGQPFEKNLLKQTDNSIYWLQTFLKARLGSKLWVHSAVVFPNARVEVRGKLHGVSVINATHLKRWMWRSGGNPFIAALVWPHVETLQRELLEQSARNDLR